MPPRNHYSQFQLARHLIADLLSDARSSTGAYRASCIEQAMRLFRARHGDGARTNQFGWPQVLAS